MKNMKKILSALTSLSFATISGISVVACGTSDTDNSLQPGMNSEVLKDLGLSDDKGQSTVETTIDGNAWNVSIEDINATDLLKDTKAKDESAYDFLVNVLKLEASGDKGWEQDTFKVDDAKKITLDVVEGTIKPEIKATDDQSDFKVTGGTVQVQWNKQGNSQEEVINTKYDIELAKASELKVASKLPSIDEIDFDRSNFQVGKPVEDFKKGSTIAFTNSDKQKEIDLLVTLLNQGKVEFVVTDVQHKGEGKDFVAEDTAVVSIKIGNVTITEITIHVTPLAPQI